jgi:beta-lactamase class D
MNKILIFFCLLALASCSLNNTEEDAGIGKYFEENNVSGTFALFDNITGKFTVYNMGRYRDSAYPPFATYNIVTALIGLETGGIRDSIRLGKMDSVPMPAADTLKHWLDTLGYNPSKITADEQLGLVKKLYFSQLPFQPRSQRIVKGAMKQEDNSNYALSYKTGSGTGAKNQPLGWLIGWIEENNHPYFFVVQSEASANTTDVDAANLKILKSVLKQYGFMEGQK